MPVYVLYSAVMRALENGRILHYSDSMNSSSAISHDRQDETPEAKARWFQSLEMAERMQLLCELTDIAVSVNPSLMEKKHAEPAPGRIQVVSAP